MTKIELGVTYKDVITGFAGVAVGHVDYISGCNQTLLSPRVDKDNKAEAPNWIDDQRLEPVTKFKRVVLANEATPGADRPAPIRR